ncbi:TPA: hypothetical protein ACG2T7_004575, partial [Escherichia coli]
PSSQLAVVSNHIVLRETDRVTGVYQVRIHVAHPPLLCSLPFGSILFVLALPQFSQKRQTSHQPAPRLA